MFFLGEFLQVDIADACCSGKTSSPVREREINHLGGVIMPLKVFRGGR